MADCFKRAGFIRFEWWRDYGRWFHVTRRRHARRKLKQIMGRLRKAMPGPANTDRPGAPRQ